MKTVKHAWQKRNMQASAELVVGDCTEASHYSLFMHHVACAICVVETSPLTSLQYYMNYKVPGKSWSFSVSGLWKKPVGISRCYCTNQVVIMLQES